LVPWKRLDGPDQWTAIYEVDGQKLANGAPDEGVYGSTELLANVAACTSGDPLIADARKVWDGLVVG
jgi:hypothetical protein